MTDAATTLDVPPQLLDALAVRRATTRLAHEIAERHGDEPGALLLAGIRTRGVPLAARLAALASDICGSAVTACAVDASGYRDDREHPVSRGAGAVTALDGEAPVQVDGRAVVLVDDVVFTGRTVRAAIDALLACGRPASVEVLALVDRGHRELPVRATYVGKNVPTSADDRVQVRLREVDGVDGAWLISRAAL